MRFLLKLLLVIAVLLGALFVFVTNWPVTASRYIYPLVESYAIDDFVGVTADGNIEPDLFYIQPTGISTQPVVDAANRFLETLTPEQRRRTQFAVDDDEWQRWANIHISTRQGTGFLEFTSEQAEAAFALIASGLSQRGYDTARDIMRLEGHLADLLDNHVEYGEQRYWLTVMGEPSATKPWGWQLDGHHLVINFFVLGDQVVMTPTFMGSEPMYASSGPYEGTRVMDAELDAGMALMLSLSDAQQSEAILSRDKPGNNNRGELFQDNAVVPYQGLPLRALTDAQRSLAVNLISLYTGKMRPGHDQIKLTEVIKHWDQTYFAWVGGTGPNAVFYYRIHSPVVLIEYDQQGPIALDAPNVPSRNHVHTVVRTPNGNDYGKDLLRQQLLAHPH